jgi:hypothetical protein
LIRDNKETAYEDVKWTELAKVTVQWQPFIITGKKIQDP